MKIIHGDCGEKLKELADNSVDSVVTDPPYGLSNHEQQDIVDCLKAWINNEEYKPNKKGFMGKAWDSWVPSPLLWKEVYRVLKPGGHLLCFAGTRTVDLMGISLRLAGFEYRDTIMWITGQGFPKSLDIGKALDKKEGAVREIVGERDTAVGNGGTGHNFLTENSRQRIVPITVPSTDEAKKWDGWGTALKPAFEPILLFRKPIEGTVAENVLKWGVGGINIDGCRVPIVGDRRTPCGSDGIVHRTNNNCYSKATTGNSFDLSKGRWPANVIHDGSEEVEKEFDKVKTHSAGNNKLSSCTINKDQIYEGGWNTQIKNPDYYQDSGSASRFFYCAKASKRDREEGCEGLEAKAYAPSNQAKAELKRGNMDYNLYKDADHDKRNNHNHIGFSHNNHPTVKSTELMKYLCRLITPPNGIILDPFMGSGSTGKAAILEGFDFIGIEQDESYIEIAKARINFARSKKYPEEKIEPTINYKKQEIQLSLF